MKIAVNTRLLLKDELEGIGWFTYESLKRITQQHPEHEFIFIFDRPYSKEFLFASNVHAKVIGPPARHPFFWYWWFEYSIPKVLKKINADLFLSPDCYATLRSPCKQIVVVHDISFEHFAYQLPRLVHRYMKKYTPQFIQRADRIATVSEFSRRDIISCYDKCEEKIDVVYNGSNENFRPLNMNEKQSVKKQFTSSKDYFIYAGAINPRKNILNLYRAFNLFKQQTSSEIQLVMAGRNWGYEQADLVLSQMYHKDDVLFFGHLKREELAKVMGAATALVYVSFFEGFGIPILEAMNCDVPVIASNVSSMPEVCGDAALLTDPNSISDIASKMKLLFENEPLQKSLIEKGRLQRQKFTWQKTSELLWASMMKTLK